MEQINNAFITALRVCLLSSLQRDSSSPKSSLADTIWSHMGNVACFVSVEHRVLHPNGQIHKTKRTIGTFLFPSHDLLKLTRYYSCAHTDILDFPVKDSGLWSVSTRGSVGKLLYLVPAACLHALVFRALLIWSELSADLPRHASLDCSSRTPPETLSCSCTFP